MESLLLTQNITRSDPKSSTKKAKPTIFIPSIFIIFLSFRSGYQTGATPERIEKARAHFNVVAGYSEENKPFTPSPPPSDMKWRYFWRIGVCK